MVHMWLITLDKSNNSVRVFLAVKQDILSVMARLVPKLSQLILIDAYVLQI